MSEFHKCNRQKLMNSLKKGLIVLKSADETLRNGDVNYDFRQESNFLYLTGITKPNHALILDAKTKTACLFIPDLNEDHQIWLGPQLTTLEARKKYRIKRVYPMKDFGKILSKRAKKNKQIYSLPHLKPWLDRHTANISRDFKKLREILSKLRRIKSKEEIALMRQANRISEKAHIAAMKAAKPGMYEYELQTILEHEFRTRGARHNAYLSVVASGPQAAVLHYHDNNRRIRKQDLVLVDAGCELKGYASDITRTFPATGKFTKTQKEIYNIVLETQKLCIEKVRPGVSLKEIHHFSCLHILQKLAVLGFFKTNDFSEMIKKNVHRVFYPHGIGHLLGLDVHDVGGKQKKTKGAAGYLRTTVILEASMVVTIEPGIYFIPAILDSPKKRKEFGKYIHWKIARKYRSVGGVRIEDDILVTRNGHQNLTRVPKDVRAIERLMA